MQQHADFTRRRLIGLTNAHVSCTDSRQVTHELCHQWLYMIQEAWRLAREGAEQLVLPSGTADRTPSEVLGAAHVAAALVRLHRIDPAGADLQHAADHIRYLVHYGRGCLSLLDGIGDLTDAGRALAQRLAPAFGVALWWLTDSTPCDQQQENP
ncbi:aKG-HExxH-type peptide beta-hydroxylase [Nonomuraea sp. 10N515B]|uniref:aKG-HExxH-type peptide beta-hydroxylase n=1 Tax=Nonomuraea sp. 10N515B TaxID=3457422 RepID=UPI003FCCC20C